MDYCLVNSLLYLGISSGANVVVKSGKYRGEKGVIRKIKSKADVDIAYIQVKSMREVNWLGQGFRLCFGQKNYHRFLILSTPFVFFPPLLYLTLKILSPPFFLFDGMQEIKVSTLDLALLSSNVEVSTTSSPSSPSSSFSYDDTSTKDEKGNDSSSLTQESWLHMDLHVKIIDKNFYKGRYAKRKGVIVDIARVGECTLRLDEYGDIIEGESI